MTHALFERLATMDVIRGNEIVSEQIEKLSPIQILDFVKYSQEVTSAKNLPREKTPFVFSASTSLGGARYPCMNLECRLDHIKRMTQFAALYSDRVYFRNFFSDYVTGAKSNRRINVTELRKSFFEDLNMLLYMRPLIETQTVVPITTPNYCPHCAAKRSFGRDADKRIDKTFDALTERLNKETEVTILFDHGFYAIEARGPESLLEHGFSGYISRKPFPNLDKLPKIKAQIHAGEKVKLTRNALRTMGYDRAIADRIEHNLIFELTSSQCVNTSFLTENSIDVEVLGTLSGIPEMEQRNQILQRHLTALVPFLEDTNLSKLIKLRQNEQDSFILFRNALNQAIDEYRKQGKGFTASDAKGIYGDVIQPQLAYLDSKVRTAQRALIKGTASKVLGWVGAISFGMYAGFLPSDVAVIATSLGLVKVVQELTEGLINKSNTDESIRNEGMYFLWRVKQATAKQ